MPRRTNTILLVEVLTPINHPPYGFVCLSSLGIMRLIGASLFASLALSSLLAPPGAGALTLQIIVDNDFALFSGTSTSINTLLFQNERQWSTQLNGQTAPVPNPPSGDSYFYLLAMDGGAPAEVFGTIDGQSFVNLQGMLMSDDLSSKLSNYDFNAVTDGTYTPALADVQAALNGLSFQAPVLGCSVVCNQLGAYVSNQSYIFPTSARLFSFPVSSVPGPLPILGALTGLHASRKIRRRIQSVKA